MTKKNIILGILTGAAIVSVAAFFLSHRQSPKWDFQNDAHEDDNDYLLAQGHHGIPIANKARHRAQHLVSSIRKQG